VSESPLCLQFNCYYLTERACVNVLTKFLIQTLGAWLYRVRCFDCTAVSCLVWLSQSIPFPPGVCLRFRTSTKSSFRVHLAITIPRLKCVSLPFRTIKSPASSSYSSCHSFDSLSSCDGDRMTAISYPFVSANVDHAKGDWIDYLFLSIMLFHCFYELIRVINQPVLVYVRLP
jgi:hypothetical protein